jgi:hypothetical protein
VRKYVVEVCTPMPWSVLHRLIIWRAVAPKLRLPVARLRLSVTTTGPANQPA